MLIEKLISLKQDGRKTLALLLDPDHFDANAVKNQLDAIASLPFDIMVFVGGSLLTSDNFHTCVKAVKELTDVPVVIFPGSAYQVSASADALLYLSLVSGRNPDFLIGQHVTAVPQIKDTAIEVIPTSYLLIDCGNSTTVQYITQTQPIPFNKPEIALQTALAGAYFGHKVTYLDGGSGAQQKVNLETIQLIAKELETVLVVGGGLTSADDVKEVFEAGADIAVVGNAIQNEEFEF